MSDTENLAQCATNDSNVDSRPITTVAFMDCVLGFDSGVVSRFVDAVCASVSGSECVRGSAVG